jgi:hypothetical protein
MAVLLELLAIFGRLYAIPSHRARFNLVFVLSAGGKFSYQGSRSFIDDFNERYSGTIFIHIYLFVVCSIFGTCLDNETQNDLAFKNYSSR